MICMKTDCLYFNDLLESCPIEFNDEKNSENCLIYMTKEDFVRYGGIDNG